MIAVASAVLGIGMLFLRTREHEPAYQGKSLSEWLEVQAHQSADDENNGPSVNAIRAIGTNAVPYLVKWVSYDPMRGGFKGGLRSVARKLPNSTPPSLRLWVMEDRDETKAQQARLGFEILGEQAQSAISELTTLMTNPATARRSQATALALASIGKPAIPVLSTQLADTNCPYRRMIAAWFGTFTGLATNDSVVPPLLRALHDPDPDVISFAATGLGRIAEHDRSQAGLVVPALTNCLAAPNANSVRERLAWTLAIYGTEARAAVPQLRQLTSDPDGGVRAAATNALREIAPAELTNAPAAVPDLR